MTESQRRESHGPEQTEQIGEELAAGLRGGTTIGLVGPLGAGKTCFVRGLARGLGIPPEEIASPTFVYLVEYAGPTTLYHADLYRFADLAEESVEETLEGIGLLEAMGGNGVTAVEWWQFYRGPQPDHLVVVEFSIENVDDRAISLRVS